MKQTKLHIELGPVRDVPQASSWPSPASVQTGQPWAGIGHGLTGAAGCVMLTLGVWGLGLAALLVLGAIVCGNIVMSQDEKRTGAGMVMIVMAFAVPALCFGLHLLLWWVAAWALHH